MHKQLLARQVFTGETVEELLAQSKGFPLSFTEPRRTALQDEQPRALDQTLERLSSCSKRVYRLKSLIWFSSLIPTPWSTTVT